MSGRAGDTLEQGTGEPPGSVLTNEELRALLAPGPAEGEEPVLVLAPGAEDLAAIAARLRERGAAIVPAVNCFAALDLFRQRPYLGLVVFASALPPDVGWYLARLREADPGARVCVVRDAEGKTQLPEGVPAVGPELGDGEWDRLFGCLGLSAPAEKREEGAVRPAPTRRGTDQAPSAQTVERPPAEPRPPDPFLAFRALLEARLVGKPMTEGLLRWARQDPGVRGWVEQREEGGELRFRAAADPGEDRHRMLALLLGQVDAAGSGFAEPTAVGPFGVFPSPLDRGSWVAVWHRQAAEAQRMVLGLHSLAPLLAEVGNGGGAPPAADARERLTSLLGSRMRAAERREGRLGLLLFAPGSEEETSRLCKVLRALLRGGDWVEPIGERVYVLLEEPDRRVFPALGARLRELPGVERLRVVALGWTPLDGSAAHLLERAEQLLDSGEGGEGIPGLGE